MVARARDPRRHRRTTIPTTGSAGWPAPTCTPSSSCSRATRPSASAAWQAHQALLRTCEGVEVLSTLDLEAIPPFDYAHDHFGYRDRLSQPVIEGTGEEPTPGLGRAAEGGRVHPRLSGRRRRRARRSRSPRSCRATAASWRTAGWRSTSGASATSCGARQHARGAGARRREADGPLAQRRAAGAGAGQGRPGARRRPAAQQRLQLQAEGPARLRRAARRAHPAHEPARHRGEHEPAPHDPARRAPTVRRCPRARPTTARSAASRPSSSARASSASSSSRRTSGSTTATSTSSATSAIPFIGTHDGTLEFKIPKRPIRKTHHRSAGLHHREGRRLLLPARAAGAALPRDTGGRS